MSSSSKILKALKNDILPGRGKSRHTGNQHYAILVDRNKEAFVLANNNKGKEDVTVENIKKEIRKMTPPGRFLEKAIDGSFTVMAPDAINKKIHRALKENYKVMRTNLKNKGKIPPPRPATTSETNGIYKEDWHKFISLLDDTPRKKCKTKSLVTKGQGLEPLKNDVIIGCEYFSHPGSKFFLSLIKKHKKDFILAKDAASEANVIKTVFDEIKLQSPPGRFLVKISEEDFLDINKNESLKMIETALSENRDVILQYLNKEKKSPIRLGSFRGVVRSLSNRLSTLKIKS